jgi:hypothetical protein
MTVQIIISLLFAPVTVWQIRHNFSYSHRHSANKDFFLSYSHGANSGEKILLRTVTEGIALALWYGMGINALKWPFQDRKIGQPGNLLRQVGPARPLNCIDTSAPSNFFKLF